MAGPAVPGQSPTIICAPRYHSQRENRSAHRRHRASRPPEVEAESVDTVEKAGLTLVEPVDNLFSAIEPPGPHCYSPPCSGSSSVQPAELDTSRLSALFTRLSHNESRGAASLDLASGLLVTPRASPKSFPQPGKVTQPLSTSFEERPRLLCDRHTRGEQVRRPGPRGGGKPTFSTVWKVLWRKRKVARLAHRMCVRDLKSCRSDCLFRIVGAVEGRGGACGFVCGLLGHCGKKGGR